MGLTKVSYAMINGAPVNVLDYGATGNGATDDTTALQDAFAAVPATGGAVYLPAGTYKVSAALNVPAKTLIFGDGSGVATQGGTTIYGTHNGKILNCVTDGITIQDLCVKGPNDVTLTNSIGIYTATTSTPGGAMNFTIKSVYVLYCYDNLSLNGSYNGILSDVVTRYALNLGIRANSAQGQWDQITVENNKSHGVVINNYAGSDFNSTNAAPTISNFRTYDNGGAGIYVQGSYTGYNGATNGSTQELILDQFFISNDALGGIAFEAHPSLNLQNAASISNGQIQYAGCSSWSTRWNGANGVLISANVGQVLISNVIFMYSASNHIDHNGVGVTISGCNFSFAARGVPANALGAGNSYVAPPTPIANYNNCVNGVGDAVIMGNCWSTDPLNLKGDLNRVSNSQMASDYAATNSGGTSTQQVPVINLASGSIENYLSNVAIYQVNSGSSTSARSFYGSAGSSYSLRNCQVYNSNGASAESNGSVLSPYLDSGGGGSGVTSFNTRTGAVTSESGDYSSFYGSLGSANSWTANNYFQANGSYNFYNSLTGYQYNSIYYGVLSTSLAEQGYAFAYKTPGASSATIAYQFWGDGTAAKTGGGSWSAISDVRLKDNIQPLSGALDKITALRPVSYDWKIKNQGEPTVGFLAQDVELVMPNAISKHKPTDIEKDLITDATYAIGWKNDMFAYLVGAIKELKAEIDSLKAAK